MNEQMDWRHRAACRDEDGELFFATGIGGPALLQIAEAKTVCRRCPVAAQCLDLALTAGLDHGVFGGMSEDERRALKRRQARTRAKAAAAEPPPEPKPVLVDGELMAAPVTVVDRLYQDRSQPNERLHAVMDDGRSPCGANRVLDRDRQRRLSELADWRRCRSAGCRRVFALADEAAVSRG